MPWRVDARVLRLSPGPLESQAALWSSSLPLLLFGTVSTIVKTQARINREEQIEARGLRNTQGEGHYILYAQFDKDQPPHFGHKRDTATTKGCALFQVPTVAGHRWNGGTNGTGSENSTRAGHHGVLRGISILLFSYRL